MNKTATPVKAGMIILDVFNKLSPPLPY